MSDSTDRETADEPIGEGPFDRVFPSFIRQSLLAKILAGLVVIAILNALIGGFFYYGISQSLDEQVEQQTAATTTLQANVYDNWFQDRRQEVETMAREIPLAGDNQAISEALSDASSANDEVNNYHYVEAETGQVLASSNQEAIGSSLFEKGFTPSLFTERRFILPTQYTTVDGRQAIALGHRAPFLVEDYLVAEYEVDRAGPSFEQPIEGTTTSLVTQEGQRLLGPSVTTNTTVASPRQLEVTISDDQIVASRQLQSTSRLQVVTQTPKNNAFRLRNAILRSFAVTILLTFFMLVGVTVVGGTATLRDLNALARRAKLMGEGKLDVNLSTSREDELGVLFRSFATMRNQLEERIVEAEESQERAQEALEQAKAAREEAERAQDQAEEFNNQLQVVDRILRHNLHNSLNVIILETQTIKRQSTGEAIEAAENIEERIDQLLDEVEKQRRITRTLSVDATPVQMDIVALLHNVIETIQSEYPRATISVSGPDTALVMAVGNIEHAFRELIENGIEHNNNTDPRIDIAVECTDSRVTVAVADDGPGIPTVEREVLQGSRDIDPLHHGSGTGFWLIFWLVKRSGGELEFGKNEPRGSVVSVELKRADASE